MAAEYSATTEASAKSGARKPPIIISQLGRDRIEWKDVDYGRIGSCHIGKVLVDCKLRFSESKWGVLGQSQTPAGVIYVDLSFVQPKNHLLDHATVYISLKEYLPKSFNASSRMKRNEKDAPASTSASGLAITDQFGPKEINGTPTTQYVTTTLNMTPEVGIMGTSFGGVGFNVAKTAADTSQWSLKGSHVTGDGEDDTSSVTLRTLRWELSQDDFAAQPQHGNTFYTGLAFKHEAKPFYIKIRIDGRLRKVRDQLRCIFPPRAHSKQGTALTLIKLNFEYKTGKPLDPLARGLDESMTRKNLQAIFRRDLNASRQQQPPPPYDEDATRQVLSQEALKSEDEVEEKLAARRAKAAQNSMIEKLLSAPEVYSLKDGSGSKSDAQSSSTSTASVFNLPTNESDLSMQNIRDIDEESVNNETTKNRRGVTLEIYKNMMSGHVYGNEFWIK